MTKRSLSIGCFIVALWPALLSTARAQYDEWGLPGATVTSIDASIGMPLGLGDTTSQAVSFFDPASASLLTARCPPAPFETGSVVRREQNAAGPIAYLSTPSQRRFAVVNPKDETCDMWTINDPAFQQFGPMDYDVQHARIWFAAVVGSAGPPMWVIGTFVPTFGGPPANVRYYWLPNTTGADRITSIDHWHDASGHELVAFGVIGAVATQDNVAVLDASTATLSWWSRPLVADIEVRADGAGAVYFPFDGAADAMGRVDVVTGLQDTWVDAGNTLAGFLTVDAGGTPFASTLFPNVTRLSAGPSGVPGPMVTTVTRERTEAYWDQVGIVPTSQVLPTASSPITPVPAGPFTHYQPTGGGGPISADLTSPTRDIWLFDAFAQRIARLMP